MKKRLRKKLRLGEFQELGFQVNFDFVNTELQPADWAFADAVAAFAEENELYVAGGVNSFYVTTAHRKSATPLQRQVLIDWLDKEERITNLVVSPLSDAWYVKASEWDSVLPCEMLGRTWRRR